MRTYRAREVVDAVQWFKHGDTPWVHRDNCLHPSDWEREHPDEYGVVWNGYYGTSIGVGQWVVRYPDGHFGVWSDESFRNHWQATRAKVRA